MRTLLLTAVLGGFVWVSTVANQPPAPAAAAPAGFALRYARAKLALAETNLARVQGKNERVGGAVPAGVVAEYVRDVEIARQRLVQAQRGDDGEFAAFVARAAASAVAAQQRYAAAVEANQKNAGTFAPLDVDRLRLRAELAQVTAEEGRTLADAPRDVQLTWQLRLLHDEVEQLNEAVTRSPTVGRVAVPWVY